MFTYVYMVLLLFIVGVSIPIVLFILCRIASKAVFLSWKEVYNNPKPKELDDEEVRIDRRPDSQEGKGAE